MRIVIRSALALVVVFGLVMGLQQIAAESGEVVILSTVDAAGEPQKTRLWIVERDSQLWLRAGGPQARWYLQLLAQPLIELQRGDITRDYLAVPEPGLRSEIGDLMSEKYGWADSYIGFLFGRDASVPVNLQPMP